jgi:hypothetical protein
MRRLAALLLLAAACGGRGDAAIGEPCEADDDCARGLCVAGVASSSGACTVSCMPGSDDCPDGWHCSAATGQGVVVCSKRPATPFGEAGEAPPAKAPVKSRSD